MFGIEIVSVPLRRACPCGHEHECKAFLVRSTVAKHERENRPVRSRVAWYIGEENRGSDREHWADQGGSG